MIRPATVIWLFLVAATGYAMFQVKYEVMQQEETLKRLNQDIADSRERIRVLDAEWGYLTQPSRLKHLADRYLDLSPVGAPQIVALDAIPFRADVAPTAVNTPTAPAASPALSRAAPSRLGITPQVATLRPSAVP